MGGLVMPKKVKGQSDKRMQKWQRLQRKQKQQKQRETQLDNWFYHRYKGIFI
jgi:hypothetical protein